MPTHRMNQSMLNAQYYRNNDTHKNKQEQQIEYKTETK